jgi:glycosyltransferase involved in cell wall biosynthesis
MGHEVFVSAYWGLSGAPTQWNGITILPGFGANYCSASLGGHAKALQPDLVITLGDVWVLDHNILKEIPVAHWLPNDCRPMSSADSAVVNASGAQLIAMSRFGEKRFRNAGFDPLYVPHGIDMETFKPPEDREELRAKYGLNDRFVIGINGANNDAIRKALPEQMLAFAKFHKDHPEALLSLHTGVHQDGGQDLEAVAENLGITDCVQAVDQYRYQSGLVQPADLAEWYNCLDVLSCCSYGEGFGLPIMEAQACGVPVITTKASAMEELNPHGIQVDGEPFYNGVHKAWWIKPNISEMVAAYEAIHSGEPDRDKLRAFAEEYEVSKISKAYMKPAVDELLARMAARRG